MPFSLIGNEAIPKKSGYETDERVAQAVIANAARRMQRAITGAAVKTAVSEQRTEGSFGHRKPARSDNPKVGGSNPPPATKNRQGSTESCRFYLLPIHSSLFPKNTCRFLESNK